MIQKRLFFGGVVLGMMVGLIAGILLPKADTQVKVEATATDEARESLAAIKSEVLNISINRGGRDGWVPQVRPGDLRDWSELVNEFDQLDILSGKIARLPAEKDAGELQHQVREMMFDDTKHMLYRARVEKDIEFLDTFLDKASMLPERKPVDFGFEPKELRKEALIFARAYVTFNRPLNSDTRAGVARIMAVWHFSPQELGITVEEEKNWF